MKRLSFYVNHSLHEVPRQMFQYPPSHATPFHVPTEDAWLLCHETQAPIPFQTFKYSDRGYTDRHVCRWGGEHWWG